MGKYLQVGDGDIVVMEDGSSYFHQCCDCGLVHRIDTKIVGKKAELTYSVASKRTAMIRYWKRLKGTLNVRIWK